MKYKVGDKVKVRSKTWWNKMGKDAFNNIKLMHEYLSYITFNKEMTKFCGEMVCITKVNSAEKTYKIDKDNGAWEWSDEMFEPVYTYIDLPDLPDWWDGRPVLGYFSDISEDKAGEQDNIAYLVAINPYNEYKYIMAHCTKDGIKYWKSGTTAWKYFVPAKQEARKVYITVKENGESKEIELTEEQIKQLGI